jgi:hypothetical protein
MEGFVEGYEVAGLDLSAGAPDGDQIGLAGAHETNGEIPLQSLSDQSGAAAVFELSHPFHFLDYGAWKRNGNGLVGCHRKILTQGDRPLWYALPAVSWAENGVAYVRMRR